MTLKCFQSSQSNTAQSLVCYVAIWIFLKPTGSCIKVQIHMNLKSLEMFDELDLQQSISFPTCGKKYSWRSVVQTHGTYYFCRPHFYDNLRSLKSLSGYNGYWIYIISRDTSLWHLLQLWGCELPWNSLFYVASSLSTKLLYKYRHNERRTWWLFKFPCSTFYSKENETSTKLTTIVFPPYIAFIETSKYTTLTLSIEPI